MPNSHIVEVTHTRIQEAAFLRSAGIRAVEVPTRVIRLMLVEDDDNFREAATVELEDLGFEVSSFADGSALLAAFANGYKADVIVLDWNLPGVSGIDLIPQLRGAGIELPVVLLTGRSTLSLEHLALDCGALDFVDKSRGIPILARRVRLLAQASASLPQPSVAGDAPLTKGLLVLKPIDCRAFWNGRDVDLTLMEYKIVGLLITTEGTHITYRSVYDAMHHVGFVAGCGDDGYRTNVRSFIKRVRNKFKRLDPDFKSIVNEIGVGYCWEA